ncbi:MAG: RhuM family protein [Gammaproteobacteria bacterium]
MGRSGSTCGWSGRRSGYPSGRWPSFSIPRPTTWGLHLKNIFGDGELVEAATAEDYSVVQTEGRRRVRRQVRHYNLDAIISVGYRVNSKRGTQFRVWATTTLRDHLLRGYTLNERRLRERGIGEIEQAVGLLARTLKLHALVTDEGRAVLDVVQRYTRAWRLLLEYDEERLAAVPERRRTCCRREPAGRPHRPRRSGRAVWAGARRRLGGDPWCHRAAHPP